ncbi:DDE-type integrase/transposase/recombinase [Sulfurimonas sp.]|uniref:DDE-type integrase/transposase/recombinase n=1 Tax=Sulfurimonas sp. TaxID=2022749 RepID=UPI0025DA7FA7|nr:DDE-type integrase/transposase/recombinase [Sulfurimonas sp.]
MVKLMNSKDLSSLAISSERTVRRLTKKALENNQETITIKEQSFGFVVVHNSNGKSYQYTQLSDTKKENKKTVYQSKIKTLDLETIEHIDIIKTTSKDNKLLLIKFYRIHNYSLNSIVKSLLLTHHHNCDDKTIASNVRKINRWIKAFKDNGANALDDNRGKNTDFRKIDIAVLDMSIMAAKNRANHQGFYAVWEFYCFGILKKSGELDLKKSINKESIISYNGLVNATKKRLNECYGVSVFDDKGFDGWLQGYVVGVRDISYINQEWQVDATKFDFMCKIPNDESITGYDIGRVNFTTVIDVHSGAVIGDLTQTITSYDQVRVLFKAFEHMGKPEIIKTDNGRDYVSNHYKRVLSDLSITQVLADIGQGRQKGSVERFFNTFQTQFSKIPGYVGANVSKRTKIENQNASKIDVRTSKATRFDTNRLLTLDELRKVTNKLLANYVDNYSAFAEFLLDDEELETIKKSLGNKHRRKLSMSGIALNNGTYQGADLWMSGLNKGDYVDVYENIDDVARVWVYKDEKYIGVATNTELGLECMTIEEHKASVKAHKENHIKPFIEAQKEGMNLYQEFQDSFVEGILEEAAQYQKSVSKSPKIKSKSKSTASNDISSTKPSSFDPFEMVRELARA